MLTDFPFSIDFKLRNHIERQKLDSKRAQFFITFMGIHLCQVNELSIQYYGDVWRIIFACANIKQKKKPHIMKYCIFPLKKEILSGRHFFLHITYKL